MNSLDVYENQKMKPCRLYRRNSRSSAYKKRYFSNGALILLGGHTLDARRERSHAAMPSTGKFS